MTMNTNNGAPILTPEQVGPLLVQPMIEGSIAAQVSTVIHTESHTFRIPMIKADPSAAWVAEGEEIPVSDADLDEVEITAAKLAGLTVITSELAADSSPEATNEVGLGLARDIARQLDAAYFGTRGAGTVQPAGLEDLTGVTEVSAGTAYADLDPFVEAIAAAEGLGTTLTSFVANPADVVTLAKLRQGEGSNVPLLGPDPTRPGARLLLGVPVLSSRAVAAGTIWGLPQSRAYLVVNHDAEVTVDGSVFFTSDRVAVRGKMRVGFGWPHPAAVTKITLDEA